LAEAIVLVSVWLAVFVVCFSFRNDTFYRVVYFWSELPSRYTGMFQLPVFAGLTYPLWTALARRGGLVREISVIAIVCGMLVLAFSQWRLPWYSTVELAERSRQIDVDVAKGYSGDRGSYSRIETPWYYLLLKRQFVGGVSIADYFAERDPTARGEQASQ
jgi:hypothetical protein